MPDSVNQGAGLHPKSATSPSNLIPKVVLTPTQRKFLPLVVAIAIFMQILDATILNTALPSIARDLNQPVLSLQWAVISYALTLAIFMPMSGYLSDKYGTKKIFLIAIAIFTGGSILCAMATTLNTLVFSRVIQGLGGALLMPAARLVILQAYPRDQILRVMNYAVMPALLGPILGPLIGGYLVELASWHWIFLINVPIGIIGVVAGMKLLPEFRSYDTDMDWLGFMLFGAAVAFITLSLEFVNEVFNNPKTGIFALLVAMFGGALMSAYYWHVKNMQDPETCKNNTAKPLFGLDLFAVRTFRIGIFGSLFTRLGMGAVPFLLPLLLQVVFGYTPSEAGWMLAPIAIGALITKPLVTFLVKNFGYRNVLVGNTIIIGINIILLSQLAPDTPRWLSVLMLGFMGACNSIQFSSMNTVSLIDLSHEQTSSGNSLVSVTQQLSISFGIALGSAVLHLFTPASATPTEAYSAFSHSFILLGVITILAGLSFTRLHKNDGMAKVAAKPA